MIKESSFKYKDLVNAFGGGTAGEIAADTAIFGSAAFLVSAVARAISQNRSSVHDYGGAPLDRQLDTTMKDPVVPGDYLTEQRKPSGKKIRKQASGEGSAWGIVDTIGDIAEGISRPFSKEFWKGEDLLRWSLPAAAAVALGIAGHKVIDNIYDKSDASALKKEQKRLTDLHKRIIFARAMQSRDALSKDEAEAVLKETGSVVRPMMTSKTANDDKPIALPAIGLVLAAAAAVGALGGYSYASARNKHRQKYEAIKAGLTQYARDNALMRTIDQKLVDDPELEKALSKIKKTKGTSPTETPIEYTPVTI